MSMQTCVSVLSSSRASCVVFVTFCEVKVLLGILMISLVSCFFDPRELYVLTRRASLQVFHATPDDQRVA